MGILGSGGGRRYTLTKETIVGEHGKIPVYGNSILAKGKASNIESVYHNTPDTVLGMMLNPDHRPLQPGFTLAKPAPVSGTDDALDRAAANMVASQKPKLPARYETADLPRPDRRPTAADKATMAAPWERALAVPEAAKPGWQQAFDEGAWGSLLLGAGGPGYQPKDAKEQVAYTLGSVYGMVPSLMVGGPAADKVAGKIAGPVTRLISRAVGRQVSQAAVQAALRTGTLFGGLRTASGLAQGEPVGQAVKEGAKEFAAGTAIGGIAPVVTGALGKVLPEAGARIIGSGATGAGVMMGKAALEYPGKRAALVKSLDLNDPWDKAILQTFDRDYKYTGAQEGLKNFILFGGMEAVNVLGAAAERVVAKAAKIGELKAQGYEEFVYQGQKTGIWVKYNPDGSIGGYARFDVDFNNFAKNFKPQPQQAGRGWRYAESPYQGLTGEAAAAAAEPSGAAGVTPYAPPALAGGTALGAAAVTGKVIPLLPRTRVLGALPPGQSTAKTAGPKLQPNVAEYLDKLKASGSTLDDVEAELQAHYEAKIEDQIRYLQASGGQGVEPRRPIRDEQGYVVGQFAGFSKNPTWYQKFYSAHGRAPNKGELREIAIQQLREGFTEEVDGEIPADNTFVRLERGLNGIKRIRETLSAGVEPGAVGESQSNANGTGIAGAGPGAAQSAGSGILRRASANAAAQDRAKSDTDLSAQAALDSAKRNIASYGKADVKAEIVEPQNTTQRQIREILKNLGYDVYYYKADESFPPDEVFAKEHPNVILVRASKKMDMLWAVGHGFFHGLKANHPDLYAQVLDAMENTINADQMAKYLDTFANLPKYQERLEKDRDLVIEEMLADEAGNTFTSKTFWENVYAMGKELFDRLIELVRAFFKKLGGKQYNNFFVKKQVDDFRAKFEEVVTEVARRTEASAGSRAVEKAVGDTEPQYTARLRGTSIEQEEGNGNVPDRTGADTRTGKLERPAEEPWRGNQPDGLTPEERAELLKAGKIKSIFAEFPVFNALAQNPDNLNRIAAREAIADGVIDLKNLSGADYNRLAKLGALTLRQVRQYVEASPDVTDGDKQLIRENVDRAEAYGYTIPDSEISFEHWFLRQYDYEYDANNFDRQRLYDIQAGAEEEDLLRFEHERYKRFISRAERAENKMGLDGGIRYSIRTKEPPKKTIKAYKLLRINNYNKKLFPLFVLQNEETPMNVFLDAEAGKRTADQNNGTWQVEGGELGNLKWRPGFHFANIPYASHIKYFKDRVWVECDVAADIDYQPEADASGWSEKVSAKGKVTRKFNPKYADLKHIPVDGYYRYKTNPNMTGSWIISGSMKINRILTDEEVDEMVRAAGYEPIPRVDKLSKPGVSDRAAYNREMRAAQKAAKEAKDTRFSAREKEERGIAPPFYSQLTRTIEQKMPNKALPAQVLGIVKSGGVKEDELKWSGFSQWVASQDKPISKQDALDYLRANELQVEEVTKDERTKFSQYALPGGENYRELLFILPEKYNPFISWDKWLSGIYTQEEFAALPQERQNYLREHYDQLLSSGALSRQNDEYRSGHWDERNVLAHTRFDDRVDSDGGRVLFVEEIQSDWHQAGRDKGYERPVPAELKKRFNDALAKMNKARADFYTAREEFGYNAPLTEQRQIMLDAEKAFEKVSEEKSAYTSGVPDAPLKKDLWWQFVLRRLIRYAAENGYDRMAFTTGKQQADRYSLEKYIGSVQVYRNYKNGKPVAESYQVFVVDKQGHTIESLSRVTATPKEITEMFGKDLGTRLIAGADKAKGHRFEASGLDLRMGGEGMKGFYDKMLPDYLNKYLRKWGAKVEELTLGKSAEKGKIPDWQDYLTDYAVENKAGELDLMMQEWVDEQNNLVLINEDGDYTFQFLQEYGGLFNKDFADRVNATDAKIGTMQQPSFPITDAMRESVLYEGQPLFAMRQKQKRQQGQAVAAQPASKRRTSPFIDQDLMPAVAGLVSGIQDTAERFMNILVPRVGVPREALDEIMRAKGGIDRFAFEMDMKMHQTKQMFDRMPEAEQISFLDRYKTGQKQPTPELQQIADFYRHMDDAMYQRIAKRKPTVTYKDNHFRIFWKVIPGTMPRKGFLGLSRRPLQGTKGFMKHATLKDVSDGIAKGGVPVSTNPQRLFEMGQIDALKFIHFHDLWERLKTMGFVKFVRVGRRMPEGYTHLNDRVAKVYLDPNIKVTEAFDEKLFEDLNTFAKSIGVQHFRKVKISGLGVSNSAWGFATPGGKVVTKFAGPESVLTHEIGHQLEWKYNIMDEMKRKHDISIGIDINKELRNLADLRYQGKKVPASFAKYVRKADEKIANLIHAYIHTPELLRETAPHTMSVLEEIIRKNPELEALQKIKPSLVLGVNVSTVNAGGRVEGGEWVVERNVARVLNNYLSRDLIRETELGKGLMAFKNNTTALELAMSFFHYTNQTIDPITSKVGIGISKAYNQGILQRSPEKVVEGLIDIVTAPAGPFEHVRTGGAVLSYTTNKQQFIQTAGGQRFLRQFPAAEQMINDLFTGGGKLTMHEDYKIDTLGALMGNINSGNYIGAMLRLFPAINEVLMKPLFEFYTPRLKIGAFFLEYSQKLSEYSAELASGQISRETLARQTWDRVENRLGELNFDNLFWDRTFKTSMQFIFRSVTWKLGALRTLGGAVTGQARNFADSIKLAQDQYGNRRVKFKAPKLDPDMATMLGMIVTVVVTSTILQYLLSGQLPEELKDFIFPRTGEKDRNGNWVRLSLPTYMRDITSLSSSPLQYIQTSLSGVWSRLMEVWQNEDYYGNYVYDPDDPTYQRWLDALYHAIPQPFSVGSYQELAKSELKPATKALSFFGITMAPKDYTITPFQKELAKAFEKRMGKVPLTPEEQVSQTQRKDLREKIAKGTATGNELREALVAGIVKPKALTKFVKYADLNTMQRMWMYLPQEEKVRLLTLNLASKEELRYLMQYEGMKGN